MKTALVGFDRILEGVADETGITNLTPFHEKIRRFIFRCEQDIGVGGSVVLKRAIYTKENNTIQRYIKFPDDYVDFEGVGNCSGPFSERDCKTYPEGIRLCHSTLPEKAVLYYWGLYCDGSGNPVTTESRYDAVVSYILWKLYSPQVFLNRNKANANIRNMYKQEYESLCLAARGNDAFPTIEGFNQLSLIQDTERRFLVNTPYQLDYCCSCINDVANGGGGGDPIDPIDPEKAMIYFWQEFSPGIQVQDVFERIEGEEFVTLQQMDLLETFQLGRFVNYDKTGRIGFAIRQKFGETFRLFDVMNNDITDAFEKQLITAPDGDFFVYVSQEFHVYSSIYFKFIKEVNRDLENLIVYWQLDSPSLTISDVSSIFTPSFYSGINNDTFESFEQGKKISFTGVGRIVFALSIDDENEIYNIYDISNNDITNSFDTFFDAVKLVRFFVTKNFQVAPTTNIKIKKQ